MSYRHRVRGTAPRKPVNPNFGRRAFLGTTAAGAVLAPFVPLLEPEARGGGATPYPTRIVFLFSANGTMHENWVPSGSETDFTLNTILASLEPYKDKLIILDGMRVIRQGLGDGHQMGMACMWTGNQLLPGPFQGGDGGTAGYSGGISVDQQIANAVGNETAYKSLEFGVMTGGANNWTRMCYAGPDQPVAPEDNPQAMFDRLFADLDVDPAGMEKLKAERRSVIDLVKGDLEGLSARYGSGDKMKIDAHLEAIRAIEMRNEAAVPACEVPTLDLGFDFYANDNFPEVSSRQIDQLVMSLACDMTRVASLQWSASVSGVRFSWLGHDMGHHDISHLGDGDASMVTRMTQVNTWYCEQVKYMLDQMAAIPEGDGTLLDHTLVVWGNELSRGNSHGNQPVPFVLAGGANGLIEMGRYLDYGDLEHNRMLVQLCHYMGLDSQASFGDNDPSSGGLPGF